MIGRRWVAAALVVTAAGCGYSTKSLLPLNYRLIYITPFINKLPLTQEPSEIQRFTSSLPKLEVDVTSEVIKRFIFDGRLHVTPNREQADLVLTGEVVDFHRQPLRLDDSGKIEEYRLNLVANLALRNAKTSELLWEEEGFVGDATYFLTGSSATSESTAVSALMTDFARRVVERTIENW